jgi:hypothetical protein
LQEGVLYRRVDSAPAASSSAWVGTANDEDSRPSRSPWRARRACNVPSGHRGLAASMGVVAGAPTPAPGIGRRRPVFGSLVLRTCGKRPGRTGETGRADEPAVGVPPRSRCGRDRAGESQEAPVQTAPRPVIGVTHPSRPTVLSPGDWSAMTALSNRDPVVVESQQVDRCLGVVVVADVQRGPA